LWVLLAMRECTHEGIFLVDSHGNEVCYDCGGLLYIVPEKGVGRYSKLAPWVRETILQGLRSGVTPYIAAGCAGISPKTWRTWMARTDEPYASFRAEVEQAQAQACASALAVVKSSDPKAWLRHAALLEGAWREPTKQVNVAVGGSGVPIQVAPAHDLSRLSSEQLAKLDEILNAAKPAELPAHADDVIDVEAEPVE